jgi:insertion element IS1 protein InsB
MPVSKITDAIQTTCFTVVDETENQCGCGRTLLRNGRTKYGKQRYLCRSCNRSTVINPTKVSYGQKYDARIVQFKKEGLGIRSTARILGISSATVVRRILEIADRILPPGIPGFTGRIQVDELHTFIQKKDTEVYVIYSWSQELKQALSLTVGTRSKANLRKVVDPLLDAGVETINTDNYSGYKGVVPKKKHTTFKRRNNGIERQNLNLRTHLKRLSRRTICFSKSIVMLEAVLKIYFWF